MFKCPGRPDKDLGVRVLSELPKWCPVTPHPKQAAFLMTDAREVLYGGAAGGGKTAAALMGALQHVDVPTYSALLVRTDREELKLEGGLIPLANEWAVDRKWHRQGARWNASDYKWTFASGAVIQFGYLKDGKAGRYLSSEWDLIHLEEATTIPESVIGELKTRQRRRVGSTVPLRFRASSNPGGVSHEYWLREYVQQGKLLAAFLDDNPGIDAAEYAETIRTAVTADRFAQLRHGRWDVNWAYGAGWDPDDFLFISNPTLDQLARVVVGIDPSGSGSIDADECGIVVAGVLMDGRTVFLRDESARLPPSRWAAHAVDIAAKLGGTIAVEANLPGAVDALEAAIANVGASTHVVPIHVHGTKESRHAPLAVRCRQAALRRPVGRALPDDVVFAEALRGSGLVGQMTSWTPSGRRRHGSPDRIDAAVVAWRECRESMMV